MPKELKITIDLDNSKAQAQARAFRADQQALQQGLVSDATRAETAKVSAARDAQGKFVSASSQAAAAVKADYKATADEAEQSYGRSKGAGIDSFTAVTIASAVARAGVATLKDLVGGLADAYSKAGAKSKEISANFASQRESLGNLAYLKGTKADNAFVVQQARFAASVGMTQAESTALQTAFMNSGAQFVGEGEGKSLNADQAEKFQSHMAKLSLARNLPPDVVADMGGQLLGMKDYSKFGAKGADVALGDLSQSLAVLSAGKGDEGRLATEVGKLAAFSMSEDETRGVFQDPTDVAKLISTVAESKVEGQAEAAASMLRAVRGFNRTKGKKSLKAAGVTAEDDPFEAVKKIGDWATAEAAKGPAGTKPQDILNAGFDDSLAAEMIGSVYNKGVVGGVFSARDATAAANAGPDRALAQNADFLKGDRGAARLAQGEIDLATVERGEENSDLTTLRKQATARLIRDKRIDTNSTNFNDYLNKKASFGLLGDPEQKRIDDEAQRMLMERSPAGTASAPWSDIFNVSPTAREEDLNARMGRIREAGGDPLGGGGGGGDTRQLLERIAQGVEQQNKKPPQAPPPRPIMAAPTAIRR